MDLDVPYIRQPLNSMWCGAASAAMVMKYYGVKVSQKKIAKELPIIKSGVSAGRLGYYFLRKGFDVTIQFWLRGLEPRFREVRGDRDNSLLIEGLQRGFRQRRHSRTRDVCREMLIFLNRGGNVNLKPLLLRDIEVELNQERPLILQVDSAWLSMESRTQQGHYVVVKGYSNPWERDSQVTWPGLSIHCPADGPDKFFYFDELIYSCHIWYGCAMFVKPRH